MTPYGFFPVLPTALNSLTATGLILVAGLLGAHLLRRVFPQVPAITGYVLTGLLIGPSVLNLIDASLLAEMDLFVDLALGLVLFELGRRIDYRWLLRERGLLFTGIALGTVAFFALFLLLCWFNVNKLVATMVAALGMATSPAVVLNVVRELKAEGQLTERMLHIVAIGNAMGFVAFTIGLVVVHVEYQAGWQSYLLHPLYLLLGSALLGWVMSQLLIWIGHYLGRDLQARTILALALIAATVGIAFMLNLSTLIALLLFGIASRSTHARHPVVETDLSPFSGVLYAALFVFAGARLELSYLLTMWPAVLAFIALRVVIMVGTSTALSRLNGMSLRKGSLLGISLIPLSGFNIIMVQHAVGYYPQFGAQLSALVVAILVIIELLGPICTRYALVASGESRT